MASKLLLHSQSSIPFTAGSSGSNPLSKFCGKILYMSHVLEIKCDSGHLIYELGCSGKFWADPQLIHLWGCELAFLISFYNCHIRGW